MEALKEYRRVWDEKPVIRTIYGDIFDRIAATCVCGMTVEIGGGIGNLKERIPHSWSSDIQFGPWLDLVADAQRLPFRDGSLGNLVMLDVLHHIEYPGIFLREAARALRPGGRIIMVEPAITWGSTLFYRVMHHEPVIMRADPLSDGKPDSSRDPYASNQAIPTLIATRERGRFEATFPELRIAAVEWFSFVVYPLSGGFKPWSLIPAALVRPLLRIERAIEPILGRTLGFRMLIVVEKR